MTTDYIYGTAPYAHQHTAFMLSRDETAFGLLMEQGTGKTKVALDTAAWQYSQGRIDTLLIVAPNGVHRNWTQREVPAHVPEWCRYRAAYFKASMKAAEQKALDNVIEYGYDGLRIIAIHVDAFSQKGGRGVKLAEWCLDHFKCMMVIDESTKIKTPSARRTKALIRLGKKAVTRRILTGTPVTQGPLDVWAQFAFLDVDIIGFESFVCFRSEFANTIRHKNEAASRRRGREVFYEEIVSYKNLDDLKRRVGSKSYRVCKADCLDLPDKVYVRRPVDLSNTQRRLYREMLDESLMVLYETAEARPPAGLSPADKLIWFMDNPTGQQVVARNAAVKLMRLQQVLGGYIDNEPIESSNPRIASLMDLCDELTGKVIIWSRYKAEIRAIQRALCSEYGPQAAVVYYGDVKVDDRETAINAFMDEASPVRFFVAQQHAGGYGLTLTIATSTIYYSNDFSLEARLQSEDRNHRISQTESVTYYDLEATGTVDTQILDALVNKKRMADEMTGDTQNQEWLR